MPVAGGGAVTPGMRGEAPRLVLGARWVALGARGLVPGPPWRAGAGVLVWAAGRITEVRVAWPWATTTVASPRASRLVSTAVSMTQPPAGR